MNYSDAIEYLRENNITKEDGSFYEFGEVWIKVCYIIFLDKIYSCYRLL